VIGTVAFDKTLEPIVTAFFDRLKGDEEKFLVELSPRLVLGVVRLAKARARMSMRSTVTQEDVEDAIAVFRASLALGHDHVTLRREAKRS
jgi:DNA replicative helicase MCM subunit Mcm2 (Cdc46/Mcm family)